VILAGVMVANSSDAEPSDGSRLTHFPAEPTPPAMAEQQKRMRGPMALVPGSEPEAG
jgi:hypothetical protein